jgi:hypothetical protein
VDADCGEEDDRSDRHEQDAATQRTWDLARQGRAPSMAMGRNDSITRSTAIARLART